MNTNVGMPVIICSVGRSGSTTLQRIINTIPNANICGENYNAVIHLLMFYQSIKDTQIQLYKEFDGVGIDVGINNSTYSNESTCSYTDIISKGIKPAWYNSFHYKQIVSNIKNMILDMFNKDRLNIIWGFKEIRYNKTSLKYIELFKELFPNVRYIVHIRKNIVAQSRSGWFKNMPVHSAIQVLTTANKELIEFYKKNEQNMHIYFMSFEKLTTNINNPTHLYPLFDFLQSSNHFNIYNVKHELQITKES